MTGRDFSYTYFVSPLRYRTPDKQCGPGRYRGLTAFASLSMAVSVGRAVPEWVWMDLHSLYKLSVRIKKESNKVQDDSCAFGSSTTILDCYKQILLLSLAEPAGLMQKEMQQVYAVMSHWKKNRPPCRRCNV